MKSTGSSSRGSSFSRSAVALSLVALAALVGAAALAPRQSAAQAAAVPAALAGTWTLEGGVAQGTRVIDAAFAPTIAALPEMLHGMARDRVRGEMSPPRRIVVAVTGPRVRVAIEKERPVVVEGAVGAPATTATGVSSGTRVTPRVEGGWLELRYEGEGSVLRQLFSTEPDGSRMHVDYTITSSMISTPVRYRLEFVRAGG